MCEQRDGSVVRHCLEGIGWNSQLVAKDAPFGRWEHCPTFKDAVHRLALAVSALNAGKPLPSPAQFEQLEVPVYSPICHVIRAGELAASLLTCGAF